MDFSYTTRRDAKLCGGIFACSSIKAQKVGKTGQIAVKNFLFQRK
jgi:hypothetical protein